MSSIPLPEPPTPSAVTQERIARLRAFADEFLVEDATPLTTAQLRLINGTPIAFLEKAALFADATPVIGKSLGSDVAKLLRQAMVAETENGGIIDEAQALIRRLEIANARQKLKAVKTARALYRLAKSYVTTDEGDDAKTRVDDMQRALKSKSNRRNAKARAKRTVVAPPAPAEPPLQK
jgi:hypothetical protein